MWATSFGTISISFCAVNTQTHIHTHIGRAVYILQIFIIIITHLITRIIHFAMYSITPHAKSRIVRDQHTVPCTISLWHTWRTKIYMNTRAHVLSASTQHLSHTGYGWWGREGIGAVWRWGDGGGATTIFSNSNNKFRIMRFPCRPRTYVLVICAALQLKTPNEKCVSIQKYDGRDWNISSCWWWYYRESAKSTKKEEEEEEGEEEEEEETENKCNAKAALTRTRIHTHSRPRECLFSTQRSNKKWIWNAYLYVFAQNVWNSMANERHKRARVCVINPVVVAVVVVVFYVIWRSWLLLLLLLFVVYIFMFADAIMNFFFFSFLFPRRCCELSTWKAETFLHQICPLVQQRQRYAPNAIQTDREILVRRDLFIIMYP